MDILSIISRYQHIVDRFLKHTALLMFLALSSFSSSAISSGNFYTTGAQSTYGPVTYATGNYINVGNPASATFLRQYMDPEKAIIGSVSVGGGLEYGGVEEVFDHIDELSKSFTSSHNGDARVGDRMSGNLALQDSEIEKIIDSVGKSARALTKTLLLMEEEGYAHTYLDSNVNFLVNRDIAKGTLAFSFQSSVSSSFIGIADAVDFDSQAALIELQNLFDANLQPDDDIATYDLSGGVSLSIDPSNGDVRVQFENDSVIVGKASKVVEFGLTYSRSFSKYEEGELFWGVKSKINWIGLTQVAVRLGDITDSKELFESTDGQTFNYDIKLGLDLGLYWHAKNYAIGSTLINITQPSFDYPEIDTSHYKNESIIDKIKDESHFQLERQLNVEASLFTDDYRWFTGASFDINAIQDPLHQQFQWAVWSAGYQPPLWWFSNVRSGVKHNLVGSKLTYLNLGMTVLKYVNLDISSTLKVTRINDIDLPRGVKADLGVNFAF